MGGFRDRPRLEPCDHKEKDVQNALEEIVKMNGGSHFEIFKGAHWGIIVCKPGCCGISISGTPKNPSGHARKLLREASKCPREDGDSQNKKRG